MLAHIIFPDILFQTGNPDIGWEIESEIKDVISDILRSESPLLKALGTYITVEQNYGDLNQPNQ